MKDKVDLSKIVDWFSSTPQGQKILNESANSDVAKRKAVAERLAELRREQASALPPLEAAITAAWKALEATWAAHKTAEAEYSAAIAARLAKGGELDAQVARLEVELRDTAPAEIDGFLRRARELYGSRRLPTREALESVAAIIAEAEAMLIEPVTTDFPKRLRALEAELPILTASA
jgi:hypothetical protein